jgi:hypothetical protein
MRSNWRLIKAMRRKPLVKKDAHAKAQREDNIKRFLRA